MHILLDSVFILYTMWWSHGSLIFTSTCFLFLFLFCFNWQGHIHETHKTVWSSKQTWHQPSCTSISYMLSVQFSRSVVSNSLWPHEPLHSRPPCLSPTPRVHSDSCPSSQWCHPAISSSVIPSSSCPQPLPASESFPMSQLFAWGGQSSGVSDLASFLPKISQGYLLQNGLVGSPGSPRDSQESSPTTQFRSINSSVLSSHIHT